MKKNRVSKNIILGVLVALSVGCNASLYAMSTTETIEVALTASHYDGVQRLIRQELSKKGTAVGMTKWLKEKAINSGELPLLYEHARSSLYFDSADDEVLAQGLYAMLLLLVRAEQDVASLKKFTDYSDVGLVADLRTKALSWFLHAGIDESIEALKFSTIVAKVGTWFSNHTKSELYPNPAGAEFRHLTWFYKGVEFMNATDGRRLTCLHASNKDAIHNNRNLARQNCLDRFTYSSWTEFFAQEDERSL